MRLIDALVALESLLLIGVAVRLFFVERRLRALFGSKRSKNLEGLVAEHAEKVSKLEEKHAELADVLETLGNEFFFAVQKVGMVRFNPFSNIGGDQSFALALLDRNDTGIVVSSLYSHERQLVYAKPIEKGASSYALSKEETEALARAQKRV